MKNKLISFCMIAWLLAALPLTAMAQSFDQSQTGSISVTLVSRNSDQPMAGAELSVYHVATVAVNTYGNLNYGYTEAFADCGFSLEDPALVEKLDAFVSANDISARKTVTDRHGKAHCGDIPLGLYFVKQTGAVEGFASCSSFLVTVPMKTNSGYQYQVNASPKTDVLKLTDITIQKVWNTGSTSGLPKSVTVQLLHGGQVVKTAVLDQRNHWQITYQDMPVSDSYSIQEINIPQGFMATYSQNGFLFTVTNTPALAQTGQVVWPIPVFALAGIFFLMIGFVILRKPGKQDA